MRRSRIIVVGAGLSGLVAARRLAAEGTDLLVLEARDRVGGRAWRSALTGGVAWDAGCQVLDDRHDALIALAAELGVGVYRADPWLVDGMRWIVGDRRSEAGPPLDVDELELFDALAEAIHDLERRVDPLRPDALEDAESLDRETLAGWLQARGASAGLLAVAEAWYAIGSSSVPIEEMSLLAYAAKRAAGASGPFELRLEGGPGTLAERLAEELRAPIVLGARVTAIGQAADGVTVRCADGRIEQAGRAVVALPLTVQRDVRFDPDLPGFRRLALERARYGDVVKAVLSAGEPLHGASALTEKAFLAPHDEHDDLIVSFYASRPARELAGLPARARDMEIAHHAAAALGLSSPRTLEAIAWTNETATKGSYLIFGPGDLLAWGRHLADAHGRIHFAGSEASELPSYMEGAVRAGWRAAEEVLAAAG